ncbi:NAD(P)-dependent oxidoreductase [Demequina globuliformis]|uniref:NAD(P)-dependent oxidoreductase n=1 Tax=Demequina globuliformis TaxID=676202 RepID=UPI0007817237|nr:NAD(P)H-binding protein [Demequina globuliformis]
MATVALFGATGKTGSRVLTRLLDRGDTVRALARRASALPEHDRLVVIQGDVLDPAAVADTVEGADAVLSLFGQVKGSPRTLQTDGTANIVAAMQDSGATRLVTLSGGGLRAPQDQPAFPDRLMRGALKLMAGHVLADAEGHLEILEKSHLDWTVVRGPRLTEDPRQGSYRAGWVGVGTGMKISREDLADFIVTQIDDRTFVHQMPFVSA